MCCGLVRLLPHVMPAVMLVGASSAIAVPLLNSPIDTRVRRTMRSRAALAAAMIATVALVAGLAYWDAERESAAALRISRKNKRPWRRRWAPVFVFVACRTLPRYARCSRRDPLDRACKSLTILVRAPGTSELRATDGREIRRPVSWRPSVTANPWFVSHGRRQQPSDCPRGRRSPVFRASMPARDRRGTFWRSPAPSTSAIERRGHVGGSS